MPKTSKVRIRVASRKTLYITPTTRKQLDSQRRVLDALALKRRRPEISLSAAAKQSGTTVKTIKRYAGEAIGIRSGRLDVAASDRISRELRMLSTHGYEEVNVTSRDASRIARHHNAVRRYVIFDDDSALRRFENKTVRSQGQTYTFATDKTIINRFVRAGELAFTDIYSSVGGA